MKTLSTLTSLSIVVVVVVGTLLTVGRCKPLQQNSNDRSSNDGDDLAMDATALVDNGQSSDDEWSSSSPADRTLEKLKKATEAVNDFRRMLNDRMLISSPSSAPDDDVVTGENFKFSGALPSSPVESSSTGGRRHDKQSGKRRHRLHRNNNKNQRNKQNREQSNNNGNNNKNNNNQEIYQRDIGVAEDASGLTNFDSNDGGSLQRSFKVNTNLHNRSPTENGQQQILASERFNNFATGLFASPLECPRMHGKVTQLLCPSRRRHGYHVCIDETALCNGKTDCPNGEDEDAVNCMFYKTTMRYFKTVVDQVVQLSDHILHGRRHNTEEL